MDLHAARLAVRNFGRNVTANRLAVGMSQVELGRRSRVSPKFIGQIERGKSNPSLVTMSLVADALGSNISELLQPDKPVASLSLRVDDARRAREAVAVLASVLTPRTRVRRSSRK